AGHRAVVADTNGNAVYADSSEPSHANAVIGITTGAASEGAAVSVQNIGEMIEPSWQWAPDIPIYINANGILSQTAPTTGFSLVVGFAVTSTRIIIHITQPIILA